MSSDGATQLQLASADGGREAAGAGGRGFIISQSLMIVSVTFLVKHLTCKRQKSKILVWVIVGAAGCGCPGACSTVSSYDLQLLQSPLQNWVSGDQAVTSRHRWSAALHLGPSCQLGSASVLSLFINTPPAPLFTAHYLSVFMF